MTHMYLNDRYLEDVVALWPRPFMSFLIVKVLSSFYVFAIVTLDINLNLKPRTCWHLDVGLFKKKNVILDPK